MKSSTSRIICLSGVLLFLNGCAANFTLTSEQGPTAQNEQPPIAQDPYISSRKMMTRHQKTIVSEAKRLMKSQQWAAARNALNSELKQQETPSLIWMMAGDVERIEALTLEDPLQSDMLKKAEGHYLKGLEVNAFNYHLHNRLGATYRALGDFAAARTAYDEALKISPMLASAYLNRGILFDLYLGEKASALKDYQQYLALTEATSQQSQSKIQMRRVNGWVMDLNRQLASKTAGEAL